MESSIKNLAFTNLSFTEKQRALLAHLAVLLIMALPLFGHLNEHPLRVWDEMRNAVSALEMSHGGSPIVTTFEGQPEIWSTKPPLLIWIQALFLKVFGNNELSIRLPSAIAAALVCIALLRFAKRRTGRWLPGILAVVVLISSEGYVGYHAARYGDYDSLLTLFTTLCALFFFDFVEDEKPRWLLLSALCLTAAALTKSAAALFIVPALLSYALLRKKGSLLFRSKELYIGLAGFIVLVGGYYLLRESLQPGFFSHVYENELGGRYQNALETHSGDAWFYLSDLQQRGFAHWLWLLLPAVLAPFFAIRQAGKTLAIFCLLCALSILLIISFAGTKLWWYAVPCYPFLSLLVALFLWQLIVLLQSWKAAALVWNANFLPLVVILLLGIPAYSDIYNYSINGSGDQGDAAEYDSARFLKESLEGLRKNEADFLLGNVYPLSWYREVAKLRGQPLPEVKEDALKAGMKVMVWQNEPRDFIRNHYALREIESWHSVNVYLVEGPKTDSSATAVSPR